MAGLTVQNFVSAGGRHRRPARPDPRHRRPQRPRPRQLLGGPDPQPLLHPAAALRDRRPGPGLPGRRADAQRRQHRDRRSTGAEQTLAMGPVASQMAIKQLGTNGGGFFNVNSAYPFENANALTNFIELLLDPPHPGGPHLHLRAHGRQPAPGLGDLRGDAGDLPRRRDRGHPRRAARHSRPARRRPPDPGDRRLDRRQHGGQGAAHRDRRVGAVGERRRPSPPTARSTPPSTPSPASAAPCRCRTSAPARSSSAASAPASTRCCSTSCSPSSSAG